MKKIIIIETIILILLIIFSIDTIIDHKTIDQNHLNIAIQESKQLFNELKNVESNEKEYAAIYTEAIASYKVVYNEHRNFLIKYNDEKVHITNIMNECYSYLLRRPILNQKSLDLIDQALDFIKDYPEFSDSDYLYQLRTELEINE